jgi:rod shape determining protein RodA
MIDFAPSRSSLMFSDKVKSLPFVIIALILAIAGMGGLALYSAAGGEFNQWANKHILRFSVLFVGMMIVAFIHIKYWYWLSYPIWAVGLALLILVEIMGQVGMGAQRWINLGFMNLQPSELMKIGVIMAMARYYHDIGADKVRHYRSLILPVLIMVIPMGLVMLQPDLGTALMIGMGGVVVMFMAGVKLRLFIGGAVTLAAAIPLIYQYVLKDYQRARVDTFLDPSRDPMGAGYHVTQSKIAIGSGGWDGKGFLEGTQARLNFLPEKHTDFIFTLWAEEHGFIGGLFVIGLYLLTFIIGFIYAMQAKHIFSKLLILGLTINLSLYVMINTGMVMGVLPVVGVPLPLISYGGSAMLAALICYGLIICARIYRGQPLPKGEGI